MYSFMVLMISIISDSFTIPGKKRELKIRNQSQTSRIHEYKTPRRYTGREEYLHQLLPKFVPGNLRGTKKIKMSSRM